MKCLECENCESTSRHFQPDQEKALVGTFCIIVKTDESFAALDINGNEATNDADLGKEESVEGLLCCQGVSSPSTGGEVTGGDEADPQLAQTVPGHLSRHLLRRKS